MEVRITSSVYRASFIYFSSIELDSDKGGITQTTHPTLQQLLLKSSLYYLARESEKLYLKMYVLEPLEDI